MAYIDLAELARETGFQEKIRMAMFDVARDKAVASPAVAGDDLTFINGILNGEVSVYQISVGVSVVNSDPQNADDASLKTTVENIWPFYAVAWANRTV